MGRDPPITPQKSASSIPIQNLALNRFNKLNFFALIGPATYGGHDPPTGYFVVGRDPPITPPPKKNQSIGFLFKIETGLTN